MMASPELVNASVLSAVGEVNLLLAGKTFNNDTEELRAFSKCKEALEKLQTMLAPSERRRKDDNSVSGQWGVVQPAQWRALAGLLKHLVLPFKGRKPNASATLQQSRFAAARCVSVLVSDFTHKVA